MYSELGKSVNILTIFKGFQHLINNQNKGQIKYYKWCTRVRKQYSCAFNSIVSFLGEIMKSRYVCTQSANVGDIERSKA